jgi:hypothetical protein
LKSMASRYGVKSLRYFIEGLLIALDDHGDGSQDSWIIAGLGE